MKNLLALSILFLPYGALFAQGLEDIIVEKYYITNKSDAKYKGADKVPLNSVTYRIFVDLKAGYSLQSVFGSPEHQMKLSTSTSFFNHPSYGNSVPNLIADNKLHEGTVMLDSWIGIGGGSQQNYAILKSDDDSIGTIVHTQQPHLLQSENSLAGIPVKLKDGLINTGNLPPRVAQVGLDSLLKYLDKETTPGIGFSYITNNGGWGTFGGATGANPDTNMVCIGQFTTDGDFYFEFNIQIGSAEYGVEQYVSKNPKGNELSNTGLIISVPSISKKKSKNL